VIGGLDAGENLAVGGVEGVDVIKNCQGPIRGVDPMGMGGDGDGE
jgi:hypothetical protein